MRVAAPARRCLRGAGPRRASPEDPFPKTRSAGPAPGSPHGGTTRAPTETRPDRRRRCHRDRIASPRPAQRHRGPQTSTPRGLRPGPQRGLDPLERGPAGPDGPRHRPPFRTHPLRFLPAGLPPSAAARPGPGEPGGQVDQAGAHPVPRHRAAAERPAAARRPGERGGHRPFGRRSPALSRHRHRPRVRRPDPRPGTDARTHRERARGRGRRPRRQGGLQDPRLLRQQHPWQRVGGHGRLPPAHRAAGEGEGPRHHRPAGPQPPLLRHHRQPGRPRRRHPRQRERLRPEPGLRHRLPARGARGAADRDRQAAGGDARPARLRQRHPHRADHPAARRELRVRPLPQEHLRQRPRHGGRRRRPRLHGGEGRRRTRPDPVPRPAGGLGRLAAGLRTAVRGLPGRGRRAHGRAPADGRQRGVRVAARR